MPCKCTFIPNVKSPEFDSKNALENTQNEKITKLEGMISMKENFNFLKPIFLDIKNHFNEKNVKILMNELISTVLCYVFRINRNLYDADLRD